MIICILKYIEVSDFYIRKISQIPYAWTWTENKHIKKKNQRKITKSFCYSIPEKETKKFFEVMRLYLKVPNSTEEEILWVQEYKPIYRVKVSEIDLCDLAFAPLWRYL